MPVFVPVVVLLFGQIEIDFVVSDGTATTVLSPVINVCAYLNGGSCFQNEEEDSGDSSTNDTERFNILSCACANGYTGSFCDSDLDACEENSQPCYPGVTCNDLPPPAGDSGFQCDPCPSGYSGDGIDCTGKGQIKGTVSRIYQNFNSGKCHQIE